MKFFPHVKTTAFTGKNILKEMISFTVSQKDFPILRNPVILAYWDQSFVSFLHLKLFTFYDFSGWIQ